MAAVAAVTAWLPPAFAQTVVKVATFDSAHACASYPGWGGWMVSECENQFPELRDRVQSALLDAGTIVLSTARGGRDVPAPRLVVTGRVSTVELALARAEASDFCVGGTRAVATLDLRVREAAGGRVIFGGTVTSSVGIGSDIAAGGGGCSTATPTVMGYQRLENALALAVARRVAFAATPLRVVGAEQRRVLLNYGGMLVPLGATLQLEMANGFPVRYRVASSSRTGAVAEPIGDAGPVPLGTPALLVEDNDPAAIMRRYERVELP